MTHTSSFPSPLPTRKITTAGEPFCQLQECATSSRLLPIFQKATKPSHSQRENNNEHFLVLLHAEGVIARQLLQHLLEALVYPLTCSQNELPIVFCFFSSARFARFSLMEEKTPKERWGTKEGEDCASALGSRLTCSGGAGGGRLHAVCGDAPRRREGGRGGAAEGVRVHQIVPYHEERVGAQSDQ